MRRGRKRSIAARLTLGLGVLAAGASALAVGCGSGGGDGETAGPDAQTEAAQPIPDGTSPDPDAGTDAVADAKKDVAPPGDRFCGKLTPAPKFCDDFDDGDVANNWDIMTALPPSTIGLDEVAYVSGPASFVASAAPLTMVGSSGNASLRKTVFGAVAHVKLTFSAMFSAVTFTKGIIAVATLDVSTNHYFTLNLRDENATPAASLEEFTPGGMTRHLLTKLPPAGSWTTVVLDLDLTNGKADLTFDGMKALDAEPITAGAGTEATVRIGAVYFEGPADAFEAHFDNVVLNF